MFPNAGLMGSCGTQSLFLTSTTENLMNSSADILTPFCRQANYESALITSAFYDWISK